MMYHILKMISSICNAAIKVDALFEEHRSVIKKVSAVLIIKGLVYMGMDVYFPEYVYILENIEQGMIFGSIIIAHLIHLFRGRSVKVELVEQEV